MYFYTIFLLITTACTFSTRCADQAPPLVHVRGIKEPLTLGFNNTTPIALLKLSIALLTGIPTYQQQLYMRHTSDTMSKNSRTTFTRLDDQHTCGDYALHHNSKLELFLD